MNIEEIGQFGDFISGIGGLGILVLTFHTLRVSSINQFKSEFWSSIDQKNRIIDKLKYSSSDLGIDAFNAYSDLYTRKKDLSELGVYAEFCNHIFHQIKNRDNSQQLILNKLFFLKEDNYVELALALFTQSELRLFKNICKMQPGKYRGVDYIVQKMTSE
jgi:hypothetical protein